MAALYERVLPAVGLVVLLTRQPAGARDEVDGGGENGAADEVDGVVVVQVHRSPAEPGDVEGTEAA